MYAPYDSLICRLAKTRNLLGLLSETETETEILTWFLLHLQAVIVLAMVVMTTGFDFHAGSA